MLKALRLSLLLSCGPVACCNPALARDCKGDIERYNQAIDNRVSAAKEVKSATKCSSEWVQAREAVLRAYEDQLTIAERLNLCDLTLPDSLYSIRDGIDGFKTSTAAQKGRCGNRLGKSQQELKEASAKKSEAKGAASSACLIVTPRETAIGCGKGRRWIYTSVKSSGGDGCPKEIKFTFAEPDGTAGDGTHSTPDRIQTCGGPASNIEAVP